MFFSFPRFFGLLRRAQLPLRVYLALLTLGVLLPVVLFCLYLTSQLDAARQTESEARLLASAQHLSATLSSEFAGSIRVLSALAVSNSLQQEDFAGFYAMAQEVVETQPSWKLVILLERDGQQVINTGRPIGSLLPTVIELESFRRATEQNLPTVGNLVAGPLDRRWGVPIRVPVTVGGQLKYVLTAVLFPESLSQALERDEALGPLWQSTVADSTGTVVLRTDGPDDATGTKLPADLLTSLSHASQGVLRTPLFGDDQYLAFHREPGSGWMSLVAAPAAIVDAPRRDWLLTVGLLGAALVLAGLLGAFFVSRRLLRGIDALAAASDALAHGRRPEILASPVLEVTGLNTAFQQAADLLQQRATDTAEHLREAEEARRRAEAANVAKDEFLAMLGHELRNPLGPIRNGVSVLTTLLPGNAQVAMIRDVISRQVTHMARMVDDILDTARVARHKIDLHLAPVELGALVTDTATDIRPQFDALGISLRVEPIRKRLWVEGDRTRLAQCVGNLLHNALKFTPQGGTVTISLRSDDDSAVLSIADTGPGIDPSLKGRLFTAFSQGAQKMDRAKGGLGLGLALVKGLVELQGGSVAVENAQTGSGAIFTIRLPLSTAPAAPLHNPKKNKPFAYGRRVLVIEDIADAALMLRLLLEGEGHKVEAAGSGKEGLALVSTFRPDVVICDIGLPDMDGYALCPLLRAMPELHEALLVALTGYGQQEDVRRCLEVGFDVHLKKPVELEVLRAVLAKHRELQTAE